MMPHDTNDADVPRPAYADAAEVEAQRQLARLFQATAPADPGAAAWAGVLQRIEQRTAPRRRHSAAVVLARIGRFLVPVAVAASVLAMVWLHQGGHPPVPSATEPVEPYPVASTEDVDIISMHDDDRATLVVGTPPLTEAMVLVSPGDATEIYIEPDVDGMMPTVARAVDGMATTMIVAPLPANAGVDEKDP